MGAQTKIDGTWRDAVAPYIKVSGVWKVAKAAFIKVSGQWKAWFLQGGIVDMSFSQKITENVLVSNTRYAIEAIEVQPDGKILLGGKWVSLDASNFSLRRVNLDGTPDLAFSTNVSAFISNTVFSLVIQPDNKILVGGELGIKGLVRINSNGTNDTSFNTGGAGFNTNLTISSQIPQVFSIALQSDGKILAGGYFSSYNGVVYKGFVRLSSTGSVDSSFMSNLGTGFANSFSSNVFPIRKVVLQPDGKILVGGDFTSFNGNSTRRGIVRLNSDGTIDSSFTFSTDFSIYAVALQSDGKIVIVTSSGIRRLNSDGSNDSSFNTSPVGGQDFGADANHIIIQPDGKIIVASYETTYKGVLIKGIARLNTDGTLDSAFSTNVNVGVAGGAELSGRFVKFQGDGKILLGGNFNTFNGIASPLIVRLGAGVAQ